MSALELEVYEILKNRFSDTEAAKVIELFEAKAEEKISQKKDVFMTKNDKEELVTRMASNKEELVTRMASDKEELVTRMASNKEELVTRMETMRAELITRIETAKTDTIKWMFIFWIGQLAATAGIVFAFLNAYLKK